MRLKGRQYFRVDAVLGVCCTQHMLELCVNSWLWHGGTVSDDVTLWSVMMVELWTRNREIGIDMRMMWRIRVDMRSPEYNVPDWVGMTAYRCNDTPNQESLLPYAGMYVQLDSEFSQVQVSDENFHHLLRSHSFSLSPLPSPRNPKLSRHSRSLHAMIKSQHRLQDTLSTASSHHHLTLTPNKSLQSYLSDNAGVLTSQHPHNYELTNNFSLNSPSQLPQDRLPPHWPHRDWSPQDWPFQNSPPPE